MLLFYRLACWSAHFSCSSRRTCARTTFNCKNYRGLMSATQEALDDVVARKKKLRKEIRSRLKSLSTEEIRQQSDRVWGTLFKTPQYQSARSIGLFLSMPSGEISTETALRDASCQHKSIYVPQVGKNFEQAEMELLKVPHSNIDEDEGKLFYESWPRNKWNIPEPPDGMPLVPAKPGDIDLLVVPGLGFDRKGNRLGQGKGYYDRFIARMMQSSSPPYLVAVGLTCSKVEEAVPVNEYDQRMDLVILPGETLLDSGS